jgi:hypothetical protein
MKKEIKIYYGYIETYTIDANKHPDQQRKDLIKLIKTSNDNPIVIFCNSPYVLFYITLIEGYCHKNIPEEYKGEYKGIDITVKHFEIRKNGEIIEGKYYKSMISDENLLNDKLNEGNNLYAHLLELEQFNQLIPRCSASK